MFDLLFESERIHIANQKWWHDLEGNPIDRDKSEQLMLIITELSEAMEGARKDLMDDHLPQYKMEHVEIVDALIRALDYRWGHGNRRDFVFLELPLPPINALTGQEASVGNVLFGMTQGLVQFWETGFMWEYFDNVIDMFFAYAKWRGFYDQFHEIYEAKMAYNASRADHTIEGRKADGGKKW